LRIGAISGGLAITASAVLALPAAASVGNGNTYLISKDASGQAAAGRAYEPSISQDGRFVTFESYSNLAGDDVHDTYLRVYLRDRQTGTTTLVSRASGASGAPASFWAEGARISGSGRYVTFNSQATNLVSGFTAGSGSCGGIDGPYLTNENVYVRDLKTSTTRLVSHVPGNNTQAGNGGSEDPVISGDGMFVAYPSSASDLASGKTDCVTQIFRYDVDHNRTQLVSRASGRTGAEADAGSEQPSLSWDGSIVTFTSDGANLVSGVPGGHVYASNVEDHRTIVVSRNSSGALADDGAAGSSVSADGRYVAFQSASSNLPGGDPNFCIDQVFVRDLEDGTTTLVSRQSGTTSTPLPGASSHVAISANGKRFVFENDGTTGCEIGSFSTQLYVYDGKSNTSTLVSRASGSSGAVGNGSSEDNTIAANGKAVAFESYATNLTSDTANPPQIYVRTLGDS
jgi:dipeptidyl aminopeptidase/acylaminoacyl peptidase